MYTIKHFASRLWYADPNAPKKTVVVLGGGWNGSLAARHLSSQLDPRKHELILINERPYMINYIASARMTATTVDDLASEKKALVPFDKLFHNGNGRLVVGRAVAVEEDESGGGWVILGSGEKVRWDALVVATGCSWQGPLDFPDAHALPAHVKRWQEDVQAANDIYVVGGGPAGIGTSEFAGEINEEYPDKKVTVVHGGAKLLTSAYPDKYRDDVERKCRQRGINFVFNERVDRYPERGTRGLTTRKGTYFKSCDLAIPAFGSHPNTTALGSLPIAESGGVKVNPTMEVQGHLGIFALGDVVDTAERKQAAKGQAHLAVVVPNVVSLLEGRPLRKEYKGVPEMIVIPLGKTGGSGYLDVLWGIILGDWLSASLVGKDMFVSRARRERGL
ncbi:hypothetical protein C8Q72DRAFT_785719 [Fomitopsis betulina]|nr:hypothetical protein C8Q72DRAFT_785719 [Fomitopsis betulina]